MSSSLSFIFYGLIICYKLACEDILKLDGLAIGALCLCICLLMFLRVQSYGGFGWLGFSLAELHAFAWILTWTHVLGKFSNTFRYLAKAPELIVHKRFGWIIRCAIPPPKLLTFRVLRCLLTLFASRNMGIVSLNCIDTKDIKHYKGTKKIKN